MENGFKNKAFPLALLFLYSAITLFATLHHVPWRDEAQSWLQARDLDLMGLFRIAGYEGHPALWNLLLTPLAKSGLPILSQQLLNWGIAVTAIYILLFLSPFSILARAALSFSFLLGYEYPVISRHYMLCVLILFAIAALYPRRFERPLFFGGLVFLLFNTTVFSLPWAGALGCIYAYELWKQRSTQNEKVRWAVAGLGLMCIGGLLAFLQLLPPKDAFLTGFFPFFSLKSIPVALVNAFFQFPSLYNDFPSQLTLNVFIWPAAGLLILVLFFLGPRFLVLNTVLGILWIFYIVAFKYPPGALRHQGLILVFVVFNIWIAYAYEKESGRKTPLLRKIAVYALAFALLLSLPSTYSFHKKEYTDEFSTAKRMAAFIKENGLDSHLIIGYPSPHAVSLLPYLHGKEFLLGTGHPGTFMTWDQEYADETTSTVYDIIERIAAFPDRSNILLVITGPLPRSFSGGFSLLYQTKGGFYLGKEEAYYLYKPNF